MGILPMHCDRARKFPMIDLLTGRAPPSNERRIIFIFVE